ncbi:hypothetical protein RND81_14G171300 [Saponaria officinalis]|uniref:GRF-type domain-containing protein n=1 Tax=Saponaria officinalis TaxID=3572 RepID=A0AAW1GYV7_SAPOF
MSRSTSSCSSRNPNDCKYGVPVAIVKSWTSDNLGRRFLTSKFYNPSTQFHGCQYFKWSDEDQCQWQKDVINQLVLDKKLLKCEFEMLKADNAHLMELKIRISEENELLKLKSNLGEQQIKWPSNGPNNGGVVFTSAAMFTIGLVLLVAVVVLVKLFGNSI